jgi:hypothetical protein
VYSESTKYSKLKICRPLYKVYKLTFNKNYFFFLLLLSSSSFLPNGSRSLDGSTPSNGAPLGNDASNSLKAGSIKCKFGQGNELAPSPVCLFKKLFRQFSNALLKFL